MLFKRKVSASDPRGSERARWSPLTLALGTALWIAVLCNGPLWSALAALPEMATARGGLFIAGFALMIAAGTGALLALLAWHHTIKPAIALFLVSAALGAHFMGTYGIGVGRTMSAAVEQHHDADGIVWPLAIAPFEIAIVSLNPSDAATRDAADALYEAMRAAGLDVFYDDRDERPGVKFKDADLIGFPIRVNVGGRALKEGKFEIVPRRDRAAQAVPAGEALEAVKRLREELAGK